MPEAAGGRAEGEESCVGRARALDIGGHPRTLHLSPSAPSRPTQRKHPRYLHIRALDLPVRGARANTPPPPPARRVIEPSRGPTPNITLGPSRVLTLRGHASRPDDRAQAQDCRLWDLQAGACAVEPGRARGKPARESRGERARSPLQPLARPPFAPAAVAAVVACDRGRRRATCARTLALHRRQLRP
jgi:hypothetical protein